PAGAPYAGTLSGLPAVGVAITDDPLPLFTFIDGLLDFTVPAASLALAELSAQARIVHVIGTTGIDAAGGAQIKAASRHARIVKSGNMSVGVNLLASLVKKAAASLGDDFDIEILEMHHKHKIDAPSGTALLLGKAAADGRSVELGQKSVRVRDGHIGPRPQGAIGFATLRGGSVVGEHQVIFAGAGEPLGMHTRAGGREL